MCDFESILSDNDNIKHVTIQMVNLRKIKKVPQDKEDTEPGGLEMEGGDGS